MKIMKEYFKRLKDHAGLGAATFMTVMCFLAALSNKSLSTEGALIVGVCFSGFFWLIVLLSNFK